MKSRGFRLNSKHTVYLAHLGAIFTIICWGCSFIASKVLLDQGGFSPAEVYIYRFALAYLILLLITFKKLFSNNWKDELQLMVCGVCAGSLYFVVENYALQFTTSGNVSLLGSISPVFTTILMALVFKERIGAGVILGSTIAFLGVGCVIFSHGTGLEINPAGDLLAIGASASWAVYSIAVKRLIPIYNTLFITRKMFFYGVISALPLLWIQKAPLHLNLLFSASHIEYILNLLFLVLFCSIAGYLIWNETMKVLGPVTTNNYIYGQPLVTMIAGHFILNEHIYPLGYVGCFLIIGGLVLADKWKSAIRMIRR